MQSKKMLRTVIVFIMFAIMFMLFGIYFGGLSDIAIRIVGLTVLINLFMLVFMFIRSRKMK